MQKLFKALLVMSLVVPLHVSASKKCKKFCQLFVSKQLTVCGNETINGNLTVGGTLTLGGVPLNNLIGLAGAIGPAGASGAIGPQGVPGTPGVPGLGGVLAYAMFFGLTAGTGNPGPTDYAATVAPKTAAGTGRVPFPRTGPTAGGITSSAGPSTLIDQFILSAIGTYEIIFTVQTTEPGQLQLELNGVDLPQTVAANMNPTAGGHNIVGSAIITTTVPNSILAVINPTGNTPALTITPADGARTHANAQTVVITRIA